MTTAVNHHRPHPDANHKLSKELGSVSGRAEIVAQS